MRGEISTQPFFLGRTGFATADVLALAVQHDDVPRSEFVAVVASLRVTGGGSEIVEIGCRTSGMKLVIARCGPGARFYAAPGLVVAGEIFLAAVRIGEVADSHYSAGDLDEQFCGGFRSGKILQSAMSPAPTRIAD